jgi:hypothetical protein
MKVRELIMILTHYDMESEVRMVDDMPLIDVGEIEGAVYLSDAVMEELPDDDDDDDDADETIEGGG